MRPAPCEREIARTTGAVDWLDRHEIELTVKAGAERLRSAELFIDDRSMSEATRENGLIVETAGEARAVLRFFLPRLPPYTVKLVLHGADGKDEGSSFSVGRSSR